MASLSIWLYGICVALVEQGSHRRLRLRYTDEALRQVRLGTPLLSLNLPVAEPPFANAQTRAFLDGLLPEGETRATIAAEFHLVAADTFGLLRELGRDCAGALIVLPEGDAPPATETTQTATPLADADLDDLARGLRARPLGVSGRVRLSLAGIQDKLLLTRMPDGSWGRPVDGTPSTHILKPQHPTYPNTVENEAFCMRVAKYAGLPTAEVALATIGGRELLVIERYDRIVEPDGTVHRVHQEDFCQALGIPPSRKYQEDGGPSLRQTADVLTNAIGSAALETLLKVATLNVAIGNADAHGKNFSLLHFQDSSLQFAPFYDLMSTLAYQRYGVSEHMAMYTDSVQRIDRVTANRLVNEAMTWGLSRPRAISVVLDSLGRLPEALRQAAEEMQHLPDGLGESCQTQVDLLVQSLATVA
jgi:serine/threonine-protein kinase HipA